MTDYTSELISKLKEQRDTLLADIEEAAQHNSSMDAQDIKGT